MYSTSILYLARIFPNLGTKHLVLRNFQVNCTQPNFFLKIGLPNTKREKSMVAQWNTSPNDNFFVFIFVRTRKHSPKREMLKQGYLRQYKSIKPDNWKITS